MEKQTLPAARTAAKIGHHALVKTAKVDNTVDHDRISIKCSTIPFSVCDLVNHTGWKFSCESRADRDGNVIVELFH